MFQQKIHFQPTNIKRYQNAVVGQRTTWAQKTTHLVLQCWHAYGAFLHCRELWKVDTDAALPVADQRSVRGTVGCFLPYVIKHQQTVIMFRTLGSIKGLRQEQLFNLTLSRTTRLASTTTLRSPQIWLDPSRILLRKSLRLLADDVLVWIPFLTPKQQCQGTEVWL